MRVLVTGSRAFDSEDTIVDALLPFLDHQEDTVLVHGACPTGADELASLNWSACGGYEEPHPAKWVVNGVLDRGAGFKRNAEMVALGADVCLAFYKVGAGNRGTDHCAGLAEKAGIPVHRIYA